MKFFLFNTKANFSDPMVAVYMKTMQKRVLDRLCFKSNQSPPQLSPTQAEREIHDI